jgi:hypothetical protein
MNREKEWSFDEKKTKAMNPSQYTAPFKLYVSLQLFFPRLSVGTF